MKLKTIFMGNFKLTIMVMSILPLSLLVVLFGLSGSIFNPSISAFSIEYGTEDIEDLHIGEDFQIDDYYITSHHKHHRFYYIDDNNRLTGYGRNDFGQLGDKFL